MDALDELLGDSRAMEMVRDRLQRLLDRQQAGHRLPPILLQGETGTGKGLIARLVHRHGARRDAPFVDVNCAAIPETLVEAELFGFERGAFTDASRAKPGLFHAAHGGVLFLDEVALLPDAAQAKLLTAIEERAVRRLGSTRREPADVWVISATNTDLRGAVRARRFREDLYHRLAVFTVDLPSLRDRGRDILLLAERFLARACAEYGLPPKHLDTAAQTRLLAYVWPGNIRELGNVMERAALMADAAVVTVDSLGPLEGQGARAAAPRSSSRTATARDEAQRRELETALEETGWNVSLAADRLGIARNTVYARLERFGLRAEPPRTAAASPLQPADVAGAPASGDKPLLWGRRSLTLLRADLHSPDAADAWSQASRALEAIIAKVQSFGARVEELTPTGVVAVFGLQPAEDAPRRAAHAALAIHKEAARASNRERPRITIGLHVAPLLIGWAAGRIEIDAGAKRAAWPVLDLLLQAGKAGDTMASEAAAAFLERRFELARIDAEDVRSLAYRLTGQERRGLGLWGAMTQFVGRDGELDVLRSRLTLAEAGHGQVVAVVGEAGVGKSRLIYELAPAQRLPGWRVLEAAGISYGQAMSYLPVVALLKGYFAVEDGDDAQAVRDKVTRALLTLDASLESALPALLALLDVPVEDAAWRALDPPRRRRRTIEAVRRVLLREAREQPLLLVFEDLHWIDGETQALLDGLVDALGSERLCLVASYRLEYRHAWNGKTSYTELRLDILPPERAREFLETLLGGDPGLAPLKQLLVERGNPFFLEETVRTLLETEALLGERGKYRLARPVPALHVPPTVEAVLAARIDRLGSEDRRLLQTAAVIGKDVSLALLEAVAEMEAPALRAGMARLQGTAFLVEDPLSSDAAYTFKHALTHQVAYDVMLPERRRTLHARLTGVIEGRYPDRLAERVNELAIHAMRGELWDKAVVYCQQLGEKGYLRGAYREGVAGYEQALEALGHLPGSPETGAAAVELRLGLARCLMSLVEHSRALALLNEAEAHARKLDDRVRRGRVLSLSSWARRHHGDLEGAILAARESLDIAVSLGDPLHVAEATQNLAVVLEAVGYFQDAAGLLRRNVEALACDRPGPTRDLAIGSRTWLARVLGILGDFSEGERLGQEALRLAMEDRRGTLPLASHTSLGIVYSRKGDFEAAIRVLEEGLAEARASDDRVWTNVIAGVLGVVYARTGRCAEGIELLEEGVNDAVQMRTVYFLPLRLADLSVGYRLAGRLAEAWPLATRALELARSQTLRALEAHTLFQLGALHADTVPPDLPAAQAHYRESLALAARLGMRPLVAHCHLGLATVCRRAGTQEEARQHVATATMMYREMEMAYYLEQAEAKIKESR
jgi:transcriptional regulator with AAA-type ATPase domain/tetratricopeptide (TPR) repeat protein